MVFADTSALFAFLVADDRHHADAVRAETGLRAQREILWTIDPALTELWLLLRRETNRVLSDQLIAGLLDRGLRREPLQPESYTRAWGLAREWPDQDFSLTDRQAFAAIEHSRRHRAWSYDDDFAVIRLGPRRSRSLDLVRQAHPPYETPRPGLPAQAALGSIRPVGCAPFDLTRTKEARSRCAAGRYWVARTLKHNAQSRRAG